MRHRYEFEHRRWRYRLTSVNKPWLDNHPAKFDQRHIMSRRNSAGHHFLGTNAFHWEHPLNSSKVIQGELAIVRSSFRIRLPHDTGSDVSSGREGTSASGYSRRHHDSGIYIPHALPMVVLFLVLRRRGQCKPFRTKMLQRHSHLSPSATAHLIMDPHSPESRL